MVNLLATDWIVVATCLSLVIFVWAMNRSNVASTKHAGFVLENSVSHSRFLPSPGHKFAYTTLSVLVSVDALEQHSLDLGRGWLFGYGGLWARLTGIRPEPYLNVGSSTIRQKLEHILRLHGHEEHLQDAWMMTMPSYLGFEGINPLTVYFCYNADDLLWLIVLEVRFAAFYLLLTLIEAWLAQIHNTFGESHVHVLEVNRASADAAQDTPFQYQWTFPRAFHVSPFNDRGGFYVVSATVPQEMAYTSTTPHPDIRVDLYTAHSRSRVPQPDELKLRARLKAVRSRPLTATNHLIALSRAPFTLLLSFARIAKEAWFIHYGAPRLDVFIRPEPVSGNTGATRWQSESSMERLARRSVEGFLKKRLELCDIAVRFVPSDASAQETLFASANTPTTRSLDVSYQSFEMFKTLLETPSAAHALLLSKGIFQVSSESLFLEVFSLPSSIPAPRSFRQRLRASPVPASVELPIPPKHFLDFNSTLTQAACTLFMLSLWQGLEQIERLAFSALRARPVAGEEPWKRWERGMGIVQPARPTLGSVQSRD